MTDVTGFGLLGHSLELARGGGVSLNISYEGVPFLTQERRRWPRPDTRPAHPGATGTAIATESFCRRSCRRGAALCLPTRKPPVDCWSPARRRAPIPSAPLSKMRAIRARASSGRSLTGMRSSGSPNPVQCSMTSSIFRRDPKRRRTRHLRGSHQGCARRLAVAVVEQPALGEDQAGAKKLRCSRTTSRS